MMTGLLNAVVPERCAICGENTAASFCAACKADLPWIGIACDRCARPLASPLPEGTHCADCQRRPPPFERAVAPLLYTFPVDGALKSLKFQRRLDYAPAFGELLLSPFTERFGDVDALLPVPLHARRHAMRGFNQAAELSRPLRKRTGLPVIGNVRRTRFTEPQTGLDAAERRRNMKQAFEVHGAIGFRRPLIVDDVMTTGETCRQLAEALKAAGAETVGVLTVCRAADTCS